MSIIHINTNHRNKKSYAKNSVMSTHGQPIFGPLTVILTKPIKEKKEEAKVV